MENISKSVIMIGSVLISLIIVGVLIFSFYKISNFEKSKLDDEKVLQAIELNKKIESYNREDLYGSDIISIVNLASDYNLKNEDENIEVEVTIVKESENAKKIKKGLYNLNEILSIIKITENKEELKEFKLKKFDCIKTEYSFNKICKMQFIEK